MWKRPDSEDESTFSSTGTHTNQTSISSFSSFAAKKEDMATVSLAVIGPSITIKGEINGNEDLLIEGDIDGSIEIKNHIVTIGKNGKVSANITARAIIVEGELIGDLFGGEQIEVRKTGKVKGNVTAPRVSLEDGAKLKGTVDMDPRPVDFHSSQQSASFIDEPADEET